MATYDEPREIVPIFNPIDWIPFDDPLTVNEGDGRYLKLTGGVERGSVTFNQDITMKQDINFVNGVNTASIGIDGGGDLAFQATGSVNMNGLTLDMTGGEVHKVPLIHGPNNVDLVVEGKGTGDVVLKTNNVNRVVVADNGNIAMDTDVLFVDATNNRVGFGTVTPQARLEVAGGAMYINGAESRFWNTTYSDPDSGVARAVKISGNGLAVNGGTKLDTLDCATIQRAGTTSINNTLNLTEVIALVISTPNLGTGRSCTLRFGANTSASYNQAQFSHVYTGSGSSNNRIDFGFFGIGARMSLRGDGRLGIGTTSPGYPLEVAGTIASTSGYQTRTGTGGSFGSNIWNLYWTGSNMDLYVDNSRIGALTFNDRWVAGQVIQMVNFNGDNANPSQYTFDTATYATWVSVSFTPKSTNSRIIIQADAEYRISGSLSDTFWVRVTDAGNQRFEKTQEFANASGGGTRSGVLLPLMCSYDNTTTTARNITVDFKRGTADDDITLTAGADTNWSLTITEIQK